MAAADGHDFVLEGPPGTGKSQTITNIIAHCLAVGKRVLFVAEKRAALDVVHRRLREDGLEPFCLELHSNKSGKAEVLAQFDRALKFTDETGSSDWKRRANELAKLRSELNSYTRTLHRRYPCGLSAYQCFDHLLARQDDSIVRLDAWESILETTAETLDRSRQIARLVHTRTRALLPIAGHPLEPLACKEWSPAWAERAIQLNTNLSKCTEEFIATTREILVWMQLDRPLSRQCLSHLDSLCETLLSPLPVGPAFATTPWTQLDGDLEFWISLISERKELRASLAPFLQLESAGFAALYCERISEDSAETLFQSARTLQTLTKETQNAVSCMLEWFSAPSAEVSRDGLLDLAALADILLATDEVGAAFATAPWQDWSLQFDCWISLVKERKELRAELVDYNEAQLLALDLDLLIQKWDRAQSSWFLPKFLNLASIKRSLKKALPPKAKPDESTMGKIVSAAIRVREINQELASIDATAEALLGKIWRGGEPDAEKMVEIRKWGESLHQRLTKVAGENELWLRSMRMLLYEGFKAGPDSFAQGTKIGILLTSARDAVLAFDSASMDFTTAGKFDRRSMETSSNHLEQTVVMLDGFLAASPRIRVINRFLAEVAENAEACLGQIWAKGEPDPQSLARAREWSDSLHYGLLKLAGEDFAWLGKFKEQLATLFREGPAAYGLESSIGNRLARFRKLWSDFQQSMVEYSNVLQLRRETLELATDYLTASQALTERVAHAWPKIYEWCAWQKTRSEAIGLGLMPLIEFLESNDARDEDLPGLFERSFRRALLFDIIEKENTLREFF
jgi:hypothetical protein